MSLSGGWSLLLMTALATAVWALVTYWLRGAVNWTSVIAFAGTFALVAQVLRRRGSRSE